MAKHDPKTRDAGTDVETRKECGDQEKSASKTSQADQHSAIPSVTLPPDGGTKAWLTVAGSAAALCCSFGWCNCIGLFQAYYSENQLEAYSVDAVAWITSMQFFFMLGISPIAGTTFDNYGPTPVVAVGTFLHVFGLMMTSLSSKYYQFLLAQSVCSGIGTSLIFTPALASTQTWFHSKRALAGGLVSIGSSIGGATFPLMVQHLIPRVGFPWSMRACAFLILGLMSFSIATMRSYLNHSPRPFRIMAHFAPLKERNYAMFCATTFFMYLGMFAPLNDIVVAAESYGVPSSLAIDLVPILNGSSFLGRTIPNIIADKVGRFNVCLVGTVISAIFCLGLWLPARSSAAEVCFAVLFGISTGGLLGIGPVLLAVISPMNELGIRMGTMAAIASIAVLLGLPISEAIAARSQSYVWTAVFAGLCCLLASAGIFVLKVWVGGWRLLNKV